MAVGIDQDVNDGTAERKFPQRDFPLHDGKDFQPRAEMVGMRVGLLAGSFESMDGNVVNGEFQPREAPLEAADFDGAAGDRLQRDYQLLPHALAKEVAVEIPDGAEGRGQHGKAGNRGNESGSGFEVSGSGRPAQMPSANPV